MARYFCATLSRPLQTVDLTVCLYVCHNCEPTKMAELIEIPFGFWTRLGPTKHVLEGGAHWHNLTNTIKPYMCGGDADYCQITSTTC